MYHRHSPSKFEKKKCLPNDTVHVYSVIFFSNLDGECLWCVQYMWFQKDICKDNDNHFFSFSISDTTNLNRLTCLIYRLDRRVSFTQMINRDQIKLYTKSYSSIIMSYRQFNTVWQWFGYTFPFYCYTANTALILTYFF